MNCLLTDLAEVFPPGGVGDDAEHELAHVEGVPPVVVGHAAVVTPHRAQPPAGHRLGRVRSWEVILGHVWSNYVTVLIKSYYVVLSQCHDYVCFYAEHNFV